MKNNTNCTTLDKTSEDTSTFDKTILLQLASEIGSDTLIPDLTQIFFKNLPVTLKAIEEARAAQDSKESTKESTEELRQHFHALKGNAATFGMNDLKDMCAGLEHLYRTSSSPTLTQESFDALKITSDKAARALEDFLATL